MMPSKKPLIIILLIPLLLSGCFGQPVHEENTLPDNTNDDSSHHGGGGGGGSSIIIDDDKPTEQQGGGCNNSTDPINNISIIPGSTNTTINETLWTHVYCDAVQPIKGWECTITYDPLIVQAVETQFGGYFDGYDTFDSTPTIDNLNGSVTKLYSLTLGPGGEVTKKDVLVSIKFIAITTGTTSLTLTMIGIANSTQYIPVKTTNATVYVF